MTKIRALILALALVLPGSAAYAKGGFAIWSWGGENFYKVADLPDTHEFQINYDYVDIGVIYKEIEIFFVPILQYDIRYVAVIPYNNKRYYNLSEDQAMDMARSANISIPLVSQIKIKLNFWTAWGGNIVLGLILAPFGLILALSVFSFVFSNVRNV